jgi:hypothetical protein
MTLKYEPQKDGPLDRYIKLTDAAKILNYAHYHSVVQLIKNGQLTAYLLPHVIRRRVLLSEVVELKELNKNKKMDSSAIKRPRGRPSKY